MREKSVILIVDDVPSNLDYVEEIIYDNTVEVIRAINGIEAIEKAKEYIPDLILLDIAMPEMDGYEVCTELKSDNRFKDVPVMFLTARVQEEDIIKGFEAGAVDYILKPFNFRELLSRVQTHLDLKKKTEELKELNQNLEGLVKKRTSDLEKANNELNKAYIELTRLDYAKNEFISHINHELRTPLNGILGYTTLLEEIIDPEDHDEYLGPIQNLTQRLIKVAELSLLITELKAQNDKVQQKIISIVPTIQRAIEFFQFDEKSIEFKLNCQDNEISAVAEDSLLSTCIQIIIDNSIKYSPKNGNITIHIFDRIDRVEIEIRDNGPGFSERSLQTLFKVLEADNLNHKSHGFGLGLATAKKILELFEGDINACNSPNGGAQVTLQLKKS